MPNSFSHPMEVTPAEARRLVQDGEAALIDVREPGEFGLARIRGAVPIPIDTVRQRIQELAAGADERLLIFYCHHGLRSLNVVHWLRRQGIERCVSMAGGIDLWSLQIDPQVPRY